jgi:NitT/TauT family transport system ATP-binding protein
MIDSAASSIIAGGLAGLAARLRGVTKTYDSGVKALGPIDLDVGRGEFV